MSISPTELATGVVSGVIALGLAQVIGAFRAKSIFGPPRLTDDVPLWPLLLVTGIGGAAWLGSQIVYGAVLAIQHMRAHQGERFTTEMLTGADYAFLSTIPGAFGFVILLIGDVALRRRILERIGFTLRRLPRGLVQGLIGSAIVLPLMIGSSLLLEAIYKLFNYQHPAEHDLLRAMKGLRVELRMLLVFGATIVAPVFEEYFFRGHLQTILVRMFMPRTPIPDGPVAVIALPPELPLADGLPASLAYASPPPLPPPAPRSAGLAWLAVIITSLIFAAVHAAWTAPLIFILSLCLGYAYERTGNLWTSIVIHAVFNGASTLVYLNFM